MTLSRLTYLYIAVAVVHLYTGFHPLSLEWLRVGTKALLLPLLGLMVLTDTGIKSQRGYRFLLAALFFSWCGDLLLTREGEMFFILGIAAFLMAQISYSVVFVRCTGRVLQVPLIKRRPMVILAFMLFGAWVFLSLRPKLGALELPVLVYCVAILVMGLTAANRQGEVSARSYALVLAGSLLFITSDTILAFNKFDDPIPWADELWVMLTYCAAQLLIVRGLLAERR